MDEIKFTAKLIVTRDTIAVLQSVMNGKPFDFELPLSRIPEGEGEELEIIVRRKSVQTKG